MDGWFFSSSIQKYHFYVLLVKFVPKCSSSKLYRFNIFISHTNLPIYDYYSTTAIKWCWNSNDESEVVKCSKLFKTDMEWFRVPRILSWICWLCLSPLIFKLHHDPDECQIRIFRIIRFLNLYSFVIAI